MHFKMLYLKSIAFLRCGNIFVRNIHNALKTSLKEHKMKYFYRIFDYKHTGLENEILKLFEQRDI